MPNKHKVHSKSNHPSVDPVFAGEETGTDAEWSLFVQGKACGLMSPHGLWAKYKIRISEEEIQSLRKEIWGAFSKGD